MRTAVIISWTLGVLLSGCDQWSEKSRSGTQPNGSSQPGNTALLADGVMYLDQGWGQDERQWFYHVTQGSQLIPYSWFLVLEQPETNQSFQDGIPRFGYLAGTKDSTHNPDGLPVGFSKDPQNGEWLGLTCSACHTSEIEFESQGKTHKIRLDGGSAMADFMGFLQFLYQSLDATLKDEAKFARLAAKVLGTQAGAEEKTRLREEVAHRTKIMRGQVGLEPGSGNFTNPNIATFYGFGRADAIGLLTNQVLGVKMGLHLRNPPDAPVSYPSLWYTPKFDKLLWNGSAGQSTARNIGEALGVFAHFIPPPGNRGDRPGVRGEPFASTINVKHLLDMWSLVGKLKPPVWPGDIFGKLDPEKVRRGQGLYAGKCQGCHSLVSDDAKSMNGQLVKIMSAGTDEQMATNFACRTVTTPVEEIYQKLAEFSKTELAFAGILDLLKKFTTQDILAPECAGKTGGEGTTPARHLVQVVGVGVTLRKIAETPTLAVTLLAELTGSLSTSQLEETPSKLSAYKAGPLHGIWATAPFLHNGSVPTLEQLLRPEGERAKKFCVGSRKFDPKNVGFDTGNGQNCTGASLFDTILPGNSNRGHSQPEYGTALSDDDRRALLEYLKTL